MKYFPDFSGFVEKQVIGSKNNPVRNITTKNSTKKKAAVHSFLSIFFRGCLILRQVKNENFSTRIIHSSSSLGESGTILSIGSSPLSFQTSREDPFKSKILINQV